MSPEALSEYIERLVKEERPDELEACLRAVRRQREVADVIGSYRRRGVRSGSWDRGDITADHTDNGRQAFRSGRGPGPEAVPYVPPKRQTIRQLQRGMRKPSKKRYEAAMAPQRAQEALQKRRQAWGPVLADALARGASARQMKAYELRAVEGLKQAEAARRMPCTDRNVQKLVTKSLSWISKANRDLFLDVS